MTDPLDHDALADAEEEDLWLVSYADLLTLLIAFFALALAGATSNASALERAAQAMGLRVEKTSSLQSVREDLEKVAADPALKGATITDDARGVSLVLGDALLFDVGSDVLRPQARASLEKIAGTLKLLNGRHVVVEGHTDDVPIHTALHRSNWELSSARALTVVRVLEESGVPHERLAASGFADTRPAVVEGPLDARRAANRRVVIRVE